MKFSVCKEYAKHPWLDAEKMSPTGEVSKTHCSFMPQPLMANAHPAHLREFPHMVSNFMGRAIAEPLTLNVERLCLSLTVCVCDCTAS